jgi:signal transduction histidine kinase
MDNIRDESLKYCLGFTIVIGLALLYAGIWSLNSGITPAKIIVSSMRSGIWIACGFFLVGTALSYNLAKRSTTVASWILCVSVAAGIFALLTNTSNATFLLAFLLPILFSVFLFEWRQALLFCAFILVPTLYLYANSFEFTALQTGVLAPLAGLVSITIFLLLTVNGLFSTIEWYSEKYKTAHYNEQIIRDNEVKLERLVKSLNDYESYLRITNDLLISARDEAEKARNVKQIFVQNVSHELRTPLNLIIGFSETMINTPENYGGVNWTPELKGDLECIYQNSQHLKSLIDDVLDLAALENKKHEVAINDVDLNPIIKEAVLISQGSYIAKSLTLKTSFSQAPMMVRADSVRIKQVILNLLSNALKYTDKGGVVIATSLAGTMAMVDVRDSGKGIPKDDLDKVFEAFYQVDKKSNREDSGTGLGLAICKELVNLHGGELQISSVVGKGTTVSFTLPLTNPID